LNQKHFNAFRLADGAGGIFLTSGFTGGRRAGERPPQFVEIAFDNCTELERWKELYDFAAEMNKDGDRLHFTFFVSGVNFIADANRNRYQAPGHPRGISNIGFGGTADEVRQRVEYMNAAYLSGHEIGSHAVGHFSGRGWFAADWTRELHAFRDILANVGPNNGLGSDVKFVFAESQVTGFRAPYLDFSSGLYTALKRHRLPLRHVERQRTQCLARQSRWPVAFQSGGYRALPHQKASVADGL
jgi:peptidoglycan/xylan/chitin deacetylase (PgdA/CDA1 family)